MPNRHASLPRPASALTGLAIAATLICASPGLEARELGSAPPPPSSSRPAPPLRAARTATFRAVTGEVAIEGSTGRLRIEAWDEPNVRLTVEKRAAQASPSPKQDLDAVRVWTTRTMDGGLRIATESDAAVALTYSLRVPRGLALRVRHESGSVEIRGVMGRIQATVDTGALRVQLVDNEPVKLDARVREGQVRSSLPAVASQRDNAAPARLLYLRVRTGDIEVHRDAPFDEFAVPVELI